MAKMHSGLTSAKRNHKDEFYTTREMIEAELCDYGEAFRGKVVYCNCDDPEESEFWRFFVRNFKAYGIKKLIATHYEPDEQNYAYMLELTDEPDSANSAGYTNEPVITQIPCNGDFRSAYCIGLLQEADVVVTNPPFSLWREYISQLYEYNKEFVIVGSINGLKYKDVFPLIKEDKLWLGHSIHSGDRKFYIPDDYPLDASNCGIDDEGRRYIRVKGVRWYTNLDIPQRHRPLDLRGNYYYGNEELYPKYDNYDAIDVSKTADIPCDYYGEMGVPITFIDKYCPEQFEIVGILNNGHDNEYDFNIPLINGKQKYSRIIIRRKEQTDED